MDKGKVKFFTDRGYGFIIPELGGAEIYIHVKNCGGHELREGQTVQYQVRESLRHRGRPEAYGVTVLDDGPVRFGNGY